MKIAMCLAFVAAILVIALPGIADKKAVITANEDSWVLLGSHQVDYLIDRDEIDLDANKGPYSELKFSIKNGTLNMHKCTLFFADGTTSDIDFSKEAKSGNERIIDFKGVSKKLDKVTFWYDTKDKSDAKATVEVWGKMQSKS